MNINNMTDKEILEYFEEHYINQGKSWVTIAEELSTYTTKIMRTAKRLGIQSRNKSDAQKLVLAQGKAEHPTKGKKHSEETRITISEKQAKIWENKTEDEVELHRKESKERWDNRSEASKNSMFLKAREAIRTASREGSKTEHFILDSLIDAGYSVQFHKTHILKNQNLELDLYVEDCKTVIEIDGPSHYDPVWGEAKLLKNQKTDQEKNGLVLGSGLAMIRIRVPKNNPSKKFKRDLLDKLFTTLEKFKKDFPKIGERLVQI